MSGTHYSAAYQDALWRAYVAQDPDLRRLEARKRKSAHRRTVQIYTRRSRAQLARRLWEKTSRAAAMIAVCFVFTLALMAAALLL